MGHLIGQIIFGFFVGLIAKFLMPGRDPGGFIVTTIIGIVGALIGTFVGRAMWGGPDYSAGWTTAILGSIILLVGYRLITGGRTGTTV